MGISPHIQQHPPFRRDIKLSNNAGDHVGDIHSIELIIRGVRDQTKNSVFELNHHNL